MKAILMTRCGCKREMSIEYPPAPFLKLPLNRITPIIDPVKFSISTRTFKFQRFDRDIDIAYYLECE